MINWTHVVGTHAPHIMVFGIVLLLAQIIHQVVTTLSKNVEHTVSLGKLSFLLETILAVTLELKEIFVNIFQSVFENHGLKMLSPHHRSTLFRSYMCS
jgi:hypothetical protein